MTRDRGPFLESPFGDYTGLDTIDADDLNRFREIIFTHYGEYGRPFPWRETRDPYEILVSEIMLQQTQADRVLPKYERFIAAWPSFASLAGATLLEVYSLWQGLGYNRRAKALLEIAKRVERDFGGALPRERDALLDLPMIGPATAAAVRAFAFDRPSAYLETNIRRVFIYFFFDRRPDVKDGELLPLVEASLDPEEPREWQYALMDYGVFLKNTIPNPNRRSRHYAVQSPFEGSDRQVRGAVLRFLARCPGSPAEDICGSLPFEKERVEKAIETLTADGMVVKANAVYGIGGGEG